MMKYYFLLFALLAAACSSIDQTESVQKAAEIQCTAAYRSAVTRPIEREETITFTDVDSQQVIVFDDAVLHATYTSGDFNGERSLRLRVTESADGEQEYLAQLFQLDIDRGPVNQFVGGHGFTGLNYSYHPVSGSEMQYWCTSEE